MSLLIKKPIDNGSIVSFRLVTGETIVATFVSKNEFSIIIKRPVVANSIQQDGNFGIYFSPFCMTIDEDNEFSIPMSALLFQPVTMRDELKASYVKMMTGLDIPLGAI